MQFSKDEPGSPPLEVIKYPPIDQMFIETTNVRLITMHLAMHYLIQANKM